MNACILCMYVCMYLCMYSYKYMQTYIHKIQAYYIYTSIFMYVFFPPKTVHRGGG